MYVGVYICMYALKNGYVCMYVCMYRDRYVCVSYLYTSAMNCKSSSASYVRLCISYARAMRDITT